MFEKQKISKESIIKIITALVIASIVLLTISILTDDNDSRRQITSGSTTEKTLCNILSDIKGVGSVDVMVQYSSDNDTVSGVIVTAEGADDSVVKNNIVRGVSTLFDIPTSNVMVFEKNQEEKE